MTKDAYYFPHDGNARMDLKISALRKKYGMKGYGIFFGIIEMLRETKEYQLLDDWSSIAYDLREDEEAIVDIIKNFNLFVVDLENHFFYSKSLKERMKHLDDIRIKRSIAGRKGGLASKRQANVKQTSSIKGKESKVKYSKVKKNKENIFMQPSVTDIQIFCLERKNNIDKF